MRTYHKINTIYKRAEKGELLLGEFSCPEFQYLAQNEWEFTEKVDGTNIRIMWTEDPLDYRIKTLSFGGKTDNAQMHAPLVEYLHNTFDEQLFWDCFGYDRDQNVCLYGEGYGAGIQKGGNYGPDQKFVLFDVWINDWWLKWEDVQKIGMELNIDVVPVLGRGDLYTMTNWCKNKFPSAWGDFAAEGIVARPCLPLRTRRGDRIITKLKQTDMERIK